MGGGIRLPSLAVTMVAGGALIDMVTGTRPDDSSTVSSTGLRIFGTGSSALAYSRSSGIAGLRRACNVKTQVVRM